MRLDELVASRRIFLGTLGAALVASSNVLAEQLARTPSVTEGPFYPDKLPLDDDNDLIVVTDHMDPALGQITHLTGRILDADGKPMSDATVEIWQCDANGVYLHSADSARSKARPDGNFQGFGTFTTGSTGEYRFRTIRPVAYSGRPAPHIHYKIKHRGHELLTTQLFVRDEPGNLRDRIFLNVGKPSERELVTTDFKPLADSTLNEFAARFDIVLDRTPDERTFERQ